MKTPLRIIAGVVIFILYFAGKGIREGADETLPIDPIALGMAMHLVAMLILFVVFFYWHRTRISSPDFKKHLIPLASCWFFIGGVLLFGVFGLLIVAIEFGGEFTQSQTLQSLVSGSWIAVLMAAAALVSATGLLYGAKWAQVVAVILSFPASTGFPAGLLTALYTWWVIGSKQPTPRSSEARGLVEHPLRSSPTLVRGVCACVT